MPNKDGSPSRAIGNAVYHATGTRLLGREGVSPRGNRHLPQPILALVLRVQGQPYMRSTTPRPGGSTGCRFRLALIIYSRFTISLVRHIERPSWWCCKAYGRSPSRQTTSGRPGRGRHSRMVAV